jgi:hypothetical protein
VLASVRVPARVPEPGLASGLALVPASAWQPVPELALGLPQALVLVLRPGQLVRLPSEQRRQVPWLRPGLARELQPEPRRVLRLRPGLQVVWPGSLPKLAAERQYRRQWERCCPPASGRWLEPLATHCRRRHQCRADWRRR